MPRDRRGFTMLEVAVAVALLGILLALLIPAVVAARASARTTECKNKLRQLGTAITSFESARRQLPAGADENGYSAYVHLLPWLEEAAMSDFFSQNKTTLLDPDMTSGDLTTFMNAAGALRPAVLHCPEDQTLTHTVASSYFMNRTFDILTRSAAGPFSHGTGIRLSDVTDGLSNTAAIADAYHSELAHAHNVSNPDGLQTACEQATDTGPPPVSQWCLGLGIGNMYTHVLPLGSRSCFADGRYGGRYTTARSRHSGGANVLMLDGAVRFVSSNIDHQLWQALGTRANGETIGAF